MKYIVIGFILFSVKLFSQQIEIEVFDTAKNEYVKVIVPENQRDLFTAGNENIIYTNNIVLRELKEKDEEVIESMERKKDSIVIFGEQKD